MSIRIGKEYKLTEDGRVEYDAKAAEAKLDISTKLKRKSSKKVKPVNRRRACT